MIHFNHKWGKVEDNYQYCTVCGKARPVPPPACNHVWEVVKEINLIDGMWGSRLITGKAFIQRCTICGEMKEYRV